MHYAILFIFLLALSVPAQIAKNKITYESGDTTWFGIVVYDSTSDLKRPGVMVVHEWWGLNQFIIQKAESLAAMGYVAFAADMYGDSASTTDPKTAMKWSSHLRGSPLLRKRAGRALDQLRGHPLVNEERIAAIGFCFGGTTVLELAYGGADLKGVVSFHGGLQPPAANEMDGIKASMLILHGAQDPTVKQKQINAFKQSMQKAGVDWQMIIYGGAKHSFTNPGADEYNIESIGYDPKAAGRAWQHMSIFLKNLFDSGQKTD